MSYELWVRNLELSGRLLAIGYLGSTKRIDFFTLIVILKTLFKYRRV
jgi:hypothetical protein